MKSKNVKRLMVTGLAASLAITSGCGYFLYPERVGQTGGRVDPAIVLLDAAGLLFGIVPGVIAFAVDLTTGTIYLPSGQENVIEKHKDRLSTSFNGLPMQPVDPAPTGLDRQSLADELAMKANRPIDEAEIQFYRAQDQQARVWLRNATL